MVLVLKTSEGQTSVGSNPTLSAIKSVLGIPCSQWFYDCKGHIRRSTQEAKEDGLLNR